MNLLVLLLLPALAAAAPAAAVDGRWMLVEQSYGEGTNNLADLDRPLFLELSLSGDELTGRIWAGAERLGAADWPAFSGDAPVELLERARDGTDGVIARYRVRQAPGDPLVLEVVERYRLTAGGDELTGRMTVTFTTPEGERGSYELRRRFVRQR